MGPIWPSKPAQQEFSSSVKVGFSGRPENPTTGKTPPLRLTETPPFPPRNPPRGSVSHSLTANGYFGDPSPDDLDLKQDYNFTKTEMPLVHTGLKLV